MADKTKITKDWSNADQFLRERYEPTKKYVDNQINPEFVYDETAVSCKTVPQDVGDFAIISTIYGGTRKTVNLFSIDNAASLTNKVIKVDDTTFTLASTTDTIMNGFKANTQYTISGYLKNSSNLGNVRLQIKYTDGSSKNTVLSNNTESYVYSTVVSDAGKTISELTGYFGSSGTATIKELQIQEGTEATAYEPYGQLWNSPIESVVSTGDIWVSGIGHYGVDASGVINRYSDNYIGGNSSNKIRCKGGQKFKIEITGLPSGTTRNAYAGFWTSSGSFITRSLCENDEITAPTNAAYALFYFYSYTAISDLTGISIKLYSDKTTISVPEAIKNLADYGVGIEGVAQNYVDFENGKYYRNVKVVDMSTLSWGINSGYYYCTLSDKAKGANNIVPEKYDVADASIGAADLPDKSMRGNATSSNLFAKDSSGSPSGKLVYELATPEVIDISDIIRPIKCETGGTITLVNEHNLDVANTIIYEREVL